MAWKQVSQWWHRCLVVCDPKNSRLQPSWLHAYSDDENPSKLLVQRPLSNSKHLQNILSADAIGYRQVHPMLFWSLVKSEKHAVWNGLIFIIWGIPGSHCCFCHILKVKCLAECSWPAKQFLIPRALLNHYLHGPSLIEVKASTCTPWSSEQQGRTGMVDNSE